MKKVFSCAVIALLLSAAGAYGESITYTESVVGSGSLNGVSFSNALVTLTGTGDSTAVINAGSGLFENFVTLQGTVQGLGTFTFTAPTDFFSNESSAVAGVSGPGAEDILDTRNTGFGSYDLGSAIGPLSGGSLFNSGHVFGTSDGNFDLSSVGNSTFQATVNVGATPEPSSLMLVGTGLLGLAGMAKRRLFS